MLLIKYFDSEWNDWIDLEDCTLLQDKAKLKVKIMESEVDLSNRSIMSIAEPILASSPNVSLSKSVNISIPVKKDWPEPFKFPVHSLPAQVIQALQKKVNLSKPIHRHLRGLLLQTLCNEAVSIKSHPDHHEKVSLAKSILNEWNYLKEDYGKGYEGWLASVVDGLKQARKRTGQLKPKLKRKMIEDNIINDSDNETTPTTSEKRCTSIPCKRLKPTSLNWDPKSPDGEDELSNESLVKLMKVEMEKSESSREINKIKDMLTQTYSFQRAQLSSFVHYRRNSK